ncbi:MAG: hypothetical protein WA383_20025 [Terriglobales bacterium]
MAKKHNINQTGRAAKVHLHEIQLCKEKNESYNTRRRNATDLLRPMLQEIWKALEGGQTVNDCTSKEQWAKWFNPGAKHPDRWIQKIIADKKPNTVRVIKLTEGKVYEIEGQKFELAHLLVGPKKYGKSWVLAPLENEDPVVATKPTVTTKLQQGANRKTHLVLDADGKHTVQNNTTRCSKDATKVLVAPVGTAPTCKTCLQGTSYEAAPTEEPKKEEQPVTPIKKLKADETRYEIEMLVANFRAGNKDDTSGLSQ